MGTFSVSAHYSHLAVFIVVDKVNFSIRPPVALFHDFFPFFFFVVVAIFSI